MNRRSFLTSLAVAPFAMTMTAAARSPVVASSLAGLQAIPGEVGELALIGSDAHLTLDGNPYTIIKQYLSEDPFLKHRVDNDAFAMIEDQYDRMAYDWVDDMWKSPDDHDVSNA